MGRKIASAIAKIEKMVPVEGKEKKVTVIDVTPGSKVHSEGREALKEQVEEIKSSAADIGFGFIRLGTALHTIKAKELWRFADVPAKSFAEWSSKELGYTRMSVGNLLAVAECGLSPAKLGKLGPAIAYTVARAPDGKAMAELLELADGGASKKAIVEKAKAQREERGIKRSPGRKAGGKNKEKESDKKTTASPAITHIGKGQVTGGPAKKEETVEKFSGRLVPVKGQPKHFTAHVDGYLVQVDMDKMTVSLTAVKK